MNTAFGKMLEEVTKTKDGFRLDEGEPIVAAVRGAYAEVTGRELPLGGLRIVGDVPNFVNVGGIPAVYHSPGGSGAHADVESIGVDDLVRATRVYLLGAAFYLGYEAP